MESDDKEFMLPAAPRGLCFDRNDFIKTNFSVDNFLSEHQNVASLETMRDDLGVYLKVLRLAMIELINKDYANFVNLSATLIGFDKAIAEIQVPLGQLNDEIRYVKNCLEETMKELSMWLNQRHGLQKKKQLLKYYGQTVNCLTILGNILKNIGDKKENEQIALAERAAMQYNQLKFSISKCDSLVKPQAKMEFNDIGTKLMQVLNGLLFKFWDKCDEDSLLKVLIILNSLNRVSETELTIRKQAVAPLLQDIINESNLQKSKDGLHGIYNRILGLLNSELKIFLRVMQHSKLSFFTKQYNFLINCFWCEVESRLEVNLSSIFAPGNPQIFYHRYKESMQFIKSLEDFCLDKKTVKLLLLTSEYKSFQKRWNLPVYFQIRFQEIAGNFEASLQQMPTIDPDDGFILKETRNCWKAIQECWSDGIYIEALTHKFWKLTLQLLSRYSIWACIFCKQKTSTPKLETMSIDRNQIDGCINLFNDIQVLSKKLPILLQLVENKCPGNNNDLLKHSLGSSEEKLQDLINTVRECIVKELFDNFNIQLKQVSEIPRLYRKTNRSIPTKPCTYIENISKVMHEFKEDASKRLNDAFLVDMFHALFNKLTVSYLKYVEDVLTSVQKTEESLRRLKQIRDINATLNNEGLGITDGDKIRLQLNVDVISYAKLAETLQVDVNNIQKYKELLNVVTQAVKNIDIK